MDQEITDLINQLHDLREEWHEIEDEHKLVLNDTIQVSREAQALKVTRGAGFKGHARHFMGHTWCICMDFHGHDIGRNSRHRTHAV